MFSEAISRHYVTKFGQKKKLFSFDLSPECNDEFTVLVDIIHAIKTRVDEKSSA